MTSVPDSCTYIHTYLFRVASKGLYILLHPLKTKHHIPKTEVLCTFILELLANSGLVSPHPTAHGVENARAHGQPRTPALYATDTNTIGLP
jgi:hypothetical protein